MKKILALFLTAALLCGILAACGESEPQGGNITPLPSESEPAPTEAGNESAPTDPTPSESTSDNKDVSLGAMNGGVYTNTYAGFSMTLDENWTFATADQLQDLPDNVSDLFSDSEISDQLGAQIFDMQAENVTDLTSINVVYQKLDMTTRLTYMALTEKQIMEATLEQKDTMISSYAQAGIDVSEIVLATVTFCGETRTALKTTAKIGELPYFTLQIMDFQLGQYSVTVTFASYMEDNTENLLAMCSPV